MTKIAVNTRLLLHGKLEGIGWFTYEIFKRMAQNHPEVTFYFLFDRPFSKEFVFAPNVVPVVISPQARHPILFRIWLNFSVKRKLKQIAPDLFISPDGYLSLTTNIPQIGVMHDINFEHNPQDMPKKHLNYYKKFFPQFARKAKQLITVSNYSKKDISNTYNIPEDKISVVYNAPADVYVPISESEKQFIRNEYTGGEEYFVYVGSINARKNPVNLLLAFEKFKSTTTSKVKLLFVGSKMWSFPEFDNAYKKSNYRNDIIFTGHLQREELAKALGSSKALMFLSYFEGFGIPLVEAMQSEVPILTTKHTAMPEVCGDAALYANPFDVDDIANKMAQLDRDDDLRNNLILKGKEQVKKFSWDKSAEDFWKIIQQTINA